jgi:hypothetical protein
MYGLSGLPIMKFGGLIAGYPIVMVRGKESIRCLVCSSIRLSAMTTFAPNSGQQSFGFKDLKARDLSVLNRQAR